MKDRVNRGVTEGEELMEAAMVGAMVLLAVLVLSDSIINKLGHKH